MKTRSFIFWIYLTALGLGCCVLVWYVTAVYGPGVGTDGAIQVSTADHLLRGQGFVDYAGNPYVRWPPLYPIVLAALSMISGLDSLSIGWFLNIVLFGVNIFLGSALLYTCFQDEPLWAIAGSLVMATSVSLVSLSTNIGTDPLFITLVLCWLLVASRYLASRSRAAFLSTALLACLASLQRLPGVTLIAAGTVLILYADREQIMRAAGKALLFAALTSLPLVLWIVIHNNLQNNTLFGIPLFLMTQPLINFQDSLGKILHWFMPYSASRSLPALSLVTLLALIFLIFSRREDWRRLGSRLLGPALLPSLVFVTFYYLFLIFTINSVDTKYIYYDRYYIVMLAPMLVLAFAVLQELLLSRFPRFKNLARLATLLLLAAWLVFPLYNLNKYTHLGRTEGLPGYNKYNTRTLRQSKIINVLQEISNHDQLPIYSNYPAAVWFFTRRDAPESPRGSITSPNNLQDLLERFQGWPGNKPGYLVWFLPNDYDHVLDPQQLGQLADLTLIYQGKDGEVYQVRPSGK